jgi:hypothetical protein
MDLIENLNWRVRDSTLVLMLLEISTGARYVTPDSKIYYEKIKMCRQAEEIDFFAPDSCSLPWLGKWRNTVVHLLKRV